MNRKEIKVDGLKAISPADKDIDPEDFVEKADFDTGTAFQEMIATLKSHLVDPYLLKLTDLYTHEYGERFKEHYGAQKVHHAYIGGLLQHTQSMMQLAIFCADHYSLDKSYSSPVFFFMMPGKFSSSVFPLQ